MGDAVTVQPVTGAVIQAEEVAVKLRYGTCCTLLMCLLGGICFALHTLRRYHFFCHA